MIMKRSFSVCVTCFFLAFPRVALADLAKCSIQIEDFRSGSTYTMNHNFRFEKGTESVQKKDFEIPGNDYLCTLAFFGMKKGTKVSCEYKYDKGHTFFQSDRSVLHDENMANNLSFRHKSAHISIKTKCM